MNGTASKSTISTRGHALIKPVTSYFPAVMAAWADTYHVDTNPNGWIPLAVAQNELCHREFLDKMKEIEKKTIYDSSIMQYASGKGIPSLQLALAKMMETSFLQGCTLVNPTQTLVVSSGITGVIDNLFYAIADEGQSVLIPAPYYPVFDNDLEAKNKLKPVSLYLDLEGDIITQLDQAAATAKEQGNPVAALLITNPNNPLGIVYNRRVITAMITWCLDNKVHYVSDEVYALSIFKPLDNGDSSFVSALHILEQDIQGTERYSQEDINNYTHLLYGVSKDWGAAGLCLGLLYTRNEQLHSALNSVVYFNNVSNHTQFILAELFNDVEWCAEFTKINCNALEQSYDTLVAALDEAEIPYVAAISGMFVWIDLSGWIVGEATWEAEAELFDKLAYKGHVVLTPGKDCHAERPGYFRLCYAAMPRKALAVGVMRMKQVLDTIKC